MPCSRGRGESSACSAFDEEFAMIRALALAALVAISATAHVRADPAMDDETRDRVLLVHQSRGTLAPGTRPKCFSAKIDDTVASSQFRCPWDPPNGQPRFPSALSLWGLLGNY
jgi:hypothetical protein